MFAAPKAILGAAAVFLATACGPNPPPIVPPVPVVVPAKITPRPVCTHRDGTMGWIITLRISGTYMVREFYATGGYGDFSDVIHNAPFGLPNNPNDKYVLEDHLPWRLLYVDRNGGKHYVSDMVTVAPPPCTI